MNKVSRDIVRFAVGASVLAAASAANAQWNGQRIIDGNVVFQVASGASTGTAFGTAFGSTTTGASSYTADFRIAGTGGTDQMWSNWWWVRDGSDTRERALSVPTALQSQVVKSVSASGNWVQYSNIQIATTGAISNLRFTLSFEVVDTDGAGTAEGMVVSRLTATNVGTTAVTAVNFFHYVDYTFNNSDGLDAVAGAGSTGAYRFINITDPAGINGAHIGIGANAYTVGAFSTVGGQMGDSTIDNFTDLNAAPAPTTSTDISGLMQWNLGDLAAGASVSATGIFVIPTPGAAALLGLGGLAMSRRRRA